MTDGGGWPGGAFRDNAGVQSGKPGASESRHLSDPKCMLRRSDASARDPVSATTRSPRSPATSSPAFSACRLPHPISAAPRQSIAQPLLRLLPPIFHLEREPWASLPWTSSARRLVSPGQRIARLTRRPGVLRPPKLPDISDARLHPSFVMLKTLELTRALIIQAGSLKAGVSCTIRRRGWTRVPVATFFFLHPF